MNRSEEDYIKTIYELLINENTKLVKNTEIAEAMGFTDQSVNEMIKKLSTKGFVNFKPYKGVNLTEKGRLQAIRLIRAHRVWEVFLMKHLNYSWQEVHEQAEFLEHAGSDELIDRLYEFIGKPKYCGHGNPIPSYEGNMENIYDKQLISFDIGNSFTLKRVLDNKELLEYLDQHNFKIDDQFIIVSKDIFGGFMKLTKNNNEYVITNKIAKKLFGL